MAQATEVTRQFEFVLILAQMERGFVHIREVRWEVAGAIQDFHEGGVMNQLTKFQSSL